jgi:HSP20 family molecular chaperone IbpA
MSEFDFEKKEKCKEGCLKYTVIFLGTIIGAFLAFYLVVDLTFKSLLNPEHQMRRAEKMMQRMDRQMAHDMNRDIAVIGKGMPNPVNIEEQENAYLVRIVLKPFGDNSKNVKVSVDENNVLKIEGSHEVKKGERENMMSMLQSYQLEKKVDVNKISQKEEKGHLVVTIPYTEE